MRKFLISLLICVLIGCVCATIIYNGMKKDEKLAINNKEVTIYLFQVGAFKNYKNVDTITKTLNNYIVEEKDNTYFVYVGITKDKKNIDKLREFFNKNVNNIYVKEKKVSNINFLNHLKKYDSLLKETTNYETIKLINKEILNKYREECL